MSRFRAVVAAVVAAVAVALLVGWTTPIVLPDHGAVFSHTTPSGICPICRSRGMTSTVSVQNGGMSICATVYCQGDQFWDEDGRMHDHTACRACAVDREFYACSRGHDWAVLYPPLECWCGWPHKEASK